MLKGSKVSSWLLWPVLKCFFFSLSLQLRFPALNSSSAAAGGNSSGSLEEGAGFTLSFPLSLFFLPSHHSSIPSFHICVYSPSWLANLYYSRAISTSISWAVSILRRAIQQQADLNLQIPTESEIHIGGGEARRRLSSACHVTAVR